MSGTSNYKGEFKKSLKKCWSSLLWLISNIRDGVGWVLTLPLWPIKDRSMASINSYFFSKDLAHCRQKRREIGHMDRYLRHYLGDRKLRGIKTWEYCVLLDAIRDYTDKTVLDVGCGKSTFAYYLAKKGGSVTTFDLPSPFWGIYEKQKAYRNLNVRHEYGDVLSLPFEDQRFDLVMSISAIEHLHQDQECPDILKPYEVFLKDTVKALKEMARVVRFGGYLYITSDVYDPGKQRTDKWWQGPQTEKLVAAYDYHDFNEIFLNTLVNQGFVFDRSHDYDFNLVRNNPERANYRGRYITTFSLLMKKIAK